MSVWLTIPSKRTPAEANGILAQWRRQGYSIALVRDDIDDTISDFTLFTYPVWGRYPGYSRAVNELIKKVMEYDEEVNWFVVAGDDVQPDQNHTAREISAECMAHFTGTFGVMQPTGDRWGDGNGAYIDTIAGSAWVGREFVQRAYSGNGPFWPEYFHMYGDKELQQVADNLGVFWQRPDLTQLHQHWGRPRDGERYGLRTRMPQFLEFANSPTEWNRSKALFERRQAARFPGSEPL